jgi:hypothetical protein
MADAPLPRELVQGRGWANRRVWLAASLIFVLIRAIPNITYPIARDQATYCVIGQGLLSGQHLYRDLWDNKPPGIFYIFALIVRVFDHAMWSVGLIDILWLLVISYCIFRFAERYLGPAGGGIAVIVNASWHVWAGYWEAAQTETFLTLFVFVGYLLVSIPRKAVFLRHFAAGVALGAAFWLKYNALAFLPLVALLPYLDFKGIDEKPRRVTLTISRRDWLVRAGVLMGGLTLTVVVVLGYFRFAGAWDALKEVQFAVLPRYSAMALERTPHYSLWALLMTEYSLGLPTEIGALVALVLAWRSRDLARFAPVFAAAGIGYLCTASQVRFHAYAFETSFPFFAMIWGYLVVRLYEGFRALARRLMARGWRLARVLVWVLFASILAWPIPEQAFNTLAHYKALAAWWRNPEVFYAAYAWPNPISHFPDQMRVISYLRKNLRPGDEIFVWGSEPLIYFQTGRLCPARFVSNLALVSPWAPPRWRQEMLEDLEESPPAFLVVARDDAVPYIAYNNLDSEEFLQVFPEFAIFIDDHYEVAKDLEYFAIYRRVDFSTATGGEKLLPSQSHR